MPTGFYQLRNLGIVGTTWRLLYKLYVNFKCKVWIGGVLSDWYHMTCGIHQGRYLSLVKYISFINPLVVELEESKLCCVVNKLHASPVSYADDLATACVAKCNVDTIMQIACKHSCRWRYKFNPRKSAVLVYGKSTYETKKYQNERHHRIGNNKVHERESYDHVGVKSCINGAFSVRTIEKIKKERRAFYSVIGIGIKSRGLNMTTCNLIFWSVIAPITLYGSELWVLSEQDINEIDGFQRQFSRRIQRFHSRSPTHTSFRGLGWMRLETVLYAKKVLFLRSILCMDSRSVYRKLLISRLEKFPAVVRLCSIDKYHSPLYDIFRVTLMFEMMDMALRMADGTHMYS